MITINITKGIVLTAITGLILGIFIGSAYANQQEQIKPSDLNEFGTALVYCMNTMPIYNEQQEYLGNISICNIPTGGN